MIEPEIPPGQVLMPRDVALAQLQRAIALFFEEDYICAITLAGAAEEILGKIARTVAGKNDLDNTIEAICAINPRRTADAGYRREYLNFENRIRNALKHEHEKSTVLCGGMRAGWMIDRAIRNYWIAYKKNPPVRGFARYIREGYEY